MLFYSIYIKTSAGKFLYKCVPEYGQKKGDEPLIQSPEYETMAEAEAHLALWLWVKGCFNVKVNVRHVYFATPDFVLKPGMEIVVDGDSR